MDKTTESGEGDHLEKQTIIATADTDMSVTHIGWQWDTSNRNVGKALEKAGYKRFSAPTKKAIDEGLAVRQDGGYRWSREAVGNFILKSEYTKKSKPLSNKLVACKFLVIR